MIVTDCNDMSVSELESLNKAMNITYVINDGKIVDTKIEKQEEVNS